MFFCRGKKSLYVYCNALFLFVYIIIINVFFYVLFYSFINLSNLFIQQKKEKDQSYSGI